MAKVELEPSAAAGLDRLANPIHSRVLQILARLEHWPEVSGAKPLRGDLAGHYRIRTGDYRVQFRAVGDLVTVEKIGHRDSFYDE
jgi:mRNA-degrading endonuclease RelE of RelBE toxin-antitoxin system